MNKINIQIWDKVKNPTAKAWDDIKHVSITTKNTPGLVAQDIANTTKCPVRLTYPFGNITDVGKLNGSYFIPNQLNG